ncbi:MAG TPA: PQQ-binding-like beta-propeller repeat protein [Thermoanaerobaculia bacterium]|nr:PQQ-binding-like beta-propeller repeat protein [Thermoanaerobaculia bacterium]
MEHPRIRRAPFAPAIAAAVTLLAAPTGAAAQQHWPSFRGADALARGATDPRLPATWSTTENVAWSVEVPGLGWSSPIVWGDRIFVTSVWSEADTEEPKKGLYFGGERMKPSQDVHHWTVYCFRMSDGGRCWEREVRAAAPEFPRHLKNTYASETPTTDGERVYAYFGNVGVWAFTLDGDEVWHRRFEPAETRFGWGTAASPVVHDGTLFIVNDNDDQSFLLALDAGTGEERWRVDRDEGSNWATPFVWTNELRVELITAGTKAVRSYGLDGALLWQLRGMSSIAIPQPFSDHGLLYVASGYVGDDQRPVYAIRPGASGDITLAEGARSNEHVAWSLPQAGPYNPTPLVYGDLYYTLLDRGFLTAHDAKTGEQVYDKQRIAQGAAAFTASPWAYDGKVFLLSEDGDTFVVEAGPEYRLIGKSSLDEMCMATPAIADGSLIVRTRTRLYRLTDRNASPVERTAGEGR